LRGTWDEIRIIEVVARGAGDQKIHAAGARAEAAFRQASILERRCRSCRAHRFEPWRYRPAAAA
jgi:hypothetical protein